MTSQLMVWSDNYELTWKTLVRGSPNYFPARLATKLCKMLSFVDCNVLFPCYYDLKIFAPISHWTCSDLEQSELQPTALSMLFYVSGWISIVALSELQPCRMSTGPLVINSFSVGHGVVAGNTEKLAEASHHFDLSAFSFDLKSKAF